MNAKPVIRSQFHASLEMLRQVVECCPEDLWHTRETGAPFWQIAYHALFYAHLYLQVAEDAFVPWQRHQDESQFLGALPWPPYDEPKAPDPYTRADVLDYWTICDAEVDARVPELDLDGESGFSWLPFTKLELQVYSIRHIQQHAGELSGVLARSGVEIDWVGRRPVS